MTRRHRSPRVDMVGIVAEVLDEIDIGAIVRESTGSITGDAVDGAGSPRCGSTPSSGGSPTGSCSAAPTTAAACRTSRRTGR